MQYKNFPAKCQCGGNQYEIFASEETKDLAGKCSSCGVVTNFLHCFDNYRPSIYHISRKFPKGSIGAEIGVWRGHNSQKLATDLHPNKLYLIDTWNVEKNTDKYPSTSEDMQRVKDLFEGLPFVEIIQKTSVEASKEIPDYSLDWVYIDANHSYEGATEDIKAWYPKVHWGGMVCGHDANCEEVEKAVKDFFGYSKYDLLHKDWWVTK